MEQRFKEVICSPLRSTFALQLVAFWMNWNFKIHENLCCIDYVLILMIKVAKSTIVWAIKSRIPCANQYNFRHSELHGLYYRRTVRNLYNNCCFWKNVSGTSFLRDDFWLFHLNNRFNLLVSCRDNSRECFKDYCIFQTVLWLTILQIVCPKSNCSILFRMTFRSPYSTYR